MVRKPRYEQCECGSREFHEGFQAAVIDYELTRRGTLRMKWGYPHLMDRLPLVCVHCGREAVCKGLERK